MKWPCEPDARTSSKPSTASSPLSPEESLKKLHVPSGFRAELAASEPLVLDPVAFDWDERGRLWVVEMADYPSGMDGAGAPGGRNYGWRNKEGFLDHIQDLPPWSGLTDPILDFPRNVARSITGGFIYRGQALGPSHAGRYFTADFIYGNVWSLGVVLDGNGDNPSSVRAYYEESSEGAFTISGGVLVQARDLIAAPFSGDVITGIPVFADLPPWLVLGLVLGLPLEAQFRRALLLSDGNPMTFLTRPISLTLLLVTAALLVVLATAAPVARVVAQPVDPLLHLVLGAARGDDA